MKTYKKLKELRSKVEVFDTAHHDPGFKYGQEKMKDDVLELLDAEIELEVQKLVRQDANQSGQGELNEPVLDDDYPCHAGYAYVVDGTPVILELMGSVGEVKRKLGAKEIRRCDIWGRQEQEEKQEKVQKLCKPT